MPKNIAQQFVDRLQEYEHVIWDWNGTILNDVQVAVEAVGELLDHHNLPRPTVDEYKSHFGFPVRNYYEKLGFDLDQLSFEQLSDHFHEIYERRVREADIFLGVMETLEALAESKVQSILSAATQWHLEEIVKSFGLHIHFTHIYGLPDNLGVSKVDRGRELIHSARKPLHKTVLIGDTDHDLEVGQALGVDVLLIADGHQNLERLQKVHDNVLPSRFQR